MSEMKETLPKEVRPVSGRLLEHPYNQTEVAKTLNQLIRFLEEFLSED